MSFNEIQNKELTEKLASISRKEKVEEEEFICCENKFSYCLANLTLPFTSNFLKGCAFKAILEIIAKRGVSWMFGIKLPL